MSKDEPSGEVPAIIDAHAGQGVQVGPGGIQHNTWTTKSPLDPASLAALNPHTAVARIRKLAHDEAVDVFARASPSDMAEILLTLMQSDSGIGVAILADINPRKATQLIEPLATNVPWLVDVPEAAAAINRYAASRGLVSTHREESLWAAKTVAGTDVYSRTYEQALVSWTKRWGVRAVSGRILDYHNGPGREQGMSLFGCPIADEEIVESSPSGAAGTGQAFEGGLIYSSEHGTWGIPGLVAGKFRDLGAAGSWLGFPVSAPLETAQSFTQVFEGGAIFAAAGKAFSVRRPILEVIRYREGRWCPVSDETVAPDSPYSTKGASQEFKDAEGARISVYSSTLGTYRVVGRKLFYYRANGGTSSWLGFPKANGKGLPRTGGGFVQRFEGGNLYDKPEAGVFGVPSAVVEFVPRAEGWDRLGWPVSEEQAIGSGDDRIQFFENGAVTLRDGKREIMLRP